MNPEWMLREARAALSGMFAEELYGDATGEALASVSELVEGRILCDRATELLHRDIHASRNLWRRALEETASICELQRDEILAVANILMQRQRADWLQKDVKRVLRRVRKGDNYSHWTISPKSRALIDRLVTLFPDAPFQIEPLDEERACNAHLTTIFSTLLRKVAE